MTLTGTMGVACAPATEQASARLRRESPAGAPAPMRPMHGLEHIMAQLGVTDLIVAEVSGPLHVGALREAARAVQRAYPGLRTSVRWREGRDHRPAFVHHAPEEARVRVEEHLASAPDGSGQPEWQRSVERELNRPFDLAEGDMFRVIWIPGGPERGHVIVSAQHAVVDGISLMRLLHDVLTASAEALAGRPAAFRPAGASEGLAFPNGGAEAPASPAVLSLLGVSSVERALSSVAKRFAMRQARHFARWSVLPICGEITDGSRPVTHCRFATGEVAAWRRVREAARGRGVTVGGIFSAAVELAALRYVMEETGRTPRAWGRIRFPLTMDFNLRKQVHGRAIAPDAVGLFTGVCDVAVSVREDVTFHELARRLMERSRTQLRRRLPLLFHQVLDGSFDLEAELASRGVDFRASGGVGESINISNVGQYPYPARHGPLAIEHLFGCNSAMLGGPMLIAWLRSVNEHFCYDAIASSPACDRVRADRLFSYVVDLMERSGDDATAGMTVGEYLRPARGRHRARPGTR
jgi:hypothetical protein